MTKTEITIAQLMDFNSALKYWAKNNSINQDFRIADSESFVLPACIDYHNGTSPNPKFMSKEDYFEAVVNAELNYKTVSCAIAKVTGIIQASNNNITAIFDCREYTLSELLLEKENLKNQLGYVKSVKQYTNRMSNIVLDERRNGIPCDLCFVYGYQESNSKTADLDSKISEIDAILIKKNLETTVMVDSDLLDTLKNLLKAKIND